MVGWTLKGILCFINLPFPRGNEPWVEDFLQQAKFILRRRDSLFQLATRVLNGEWGVVCREFAVKSESGLRWGKSKVSRTRRWEEDIGNSSVYELLMRFLKLLKCFLNPWNLSYNALAHTGSAQKIGDPRLMLMSFPCRVLVSLFIFC